MGIALIKFAGWSIPIGLLVLIGIFGFISTRIDTVEGKVSEHIGKSTEKLDQIHHSVMLIEFNMRNDFENRGEKFTELRYSEEDY